MQFSIICIFVFLCVVIAKQKRTKTLTIKQFFELASKGGIYEIQTPQGWKQIGDLYIKKNKKCYEVKTLNYKCIASEDHLFKGMHGWQYNKLIELGDYICTKKGLQPVIKHKQVENRDTYDLEVLSNEHAYYSNGIISHNTGKTTLIADLPKHLKTNNKNIDISYATLTAKAALVLRNKGIPASTIHSLIYDTKIKEDPITKRVKYYFTKKSVLGCDLIVIDEASMVSDDLYADLKSFGKPIIFIGDKFQLPPINSQFNLMDDKFLSYSMTEIVRQQQDNLIITMATKLRNQEQIPYIKHEQFSKISKKVFDINHMDRFDQIITGKNKTRIELNQFYRKNILNFRSEIPVMSDKVIFLKNNYEDFVFNGQQVILDKDLYPTGKNKYLLTGTDIDSNQGVCVDVTLDFLNTLPTDVDKKYYNKAMKSKTCNIIDYAYVISCHKSQGSQWDNVLIMDDFFYYGNAEMRFRWLYTAVTRASQSVTWVI